MTDEKKKLTAAESYAQALNVSVVQMTTAINAVYLGACTGTPTIIASESSAGKTEMSKQLAVRNGMAPLLYHTAHCEPGDIRGIPFPAEGRNSYVYLTDDRIVFAPDDRPQMIILDEINRAARDTLNAIFPIWASRTVGDHKIGDRVAVIGLINPPTGGGYAVSAGFSVDPAMRRRACFIVAQSSAAAWCEYASNIKEVEKSHLPLIPDVMKTFQDEMSRMTSYHKDVIDFVAAHEAYYNDHEAQARGHVYACAAAWEAVSRLLYLEEHLSAKYGVDMEAPAMTSAMTNRIAGHLGLDVAHLFREFRSSHNFRPDLAKMVSNFAECRAEKDEIRKFIEEGRQNRLVSFCSMLAGEMMRGADREQQSGAYTLEQVVECYAGMYTILPPTNRTVFATEVEQRLQDKYGRGGTFYHRFYSTCAKHAGYAQTQRDLAQIQREDTARLREEEAAAKKK